MATRSFAPAKVNLTLNLTGLRADGYHLLDSLVVFAETGDWLTATPSDALTLTIGGPKAAGVPTGATNLVLKAAHRLRDLRGVTKGAAIHLEKHLPHGAGIGGGSSDAAAAIRLLASLWTVAPLTGPEALPLGADIPVCLAAPAPTRMQGIGEILSPWPALPPGWLVLVNPGIHIPTVQVFKKHDQLHGTGPWLAEDQTLSDQDFHAWLLGQQNMLTKVVADDGFAPVVPLILNRLRDLPGCQNCDMSGSGSTCWGWFDAEPAAHAAAASFADHPAWWISVARVLTPQDALLRTAARKG